MKHVQSWTCRTFTSPGIIETALGSINNGNDCPSKIGTVVVPVAYPEKMGTLGDSIKALQKAGMLETELVVILVDRSRIHGQRSAGVGSESEWKHACEEALDVVVRGPARGFNTPALTMMLHSY